MVLLAIEVAVIGQLLATDWTLIYVRHMPITQRDLMVNQKNLVKFEDQCNLTVL